MRVGGPQDMLVLGSRLVFLGFRFLWSGWAFFVWMVVNYYDTQGSYHWCISKGFLFSEMVFCLPFRTAL